MTPSPLSSLALPSRGLLAALLAIGFAAGSSAPATAATTLIYCSESSPEGFDPARYTSGTTFDASATPVFNRLVEFEHGGTRPLPGLAEKWTISPDGKVYTFSLRRGVKFHSNDLFKPTRDFNADDVAFTFDRMINKDNAFQKAAPASFEYAADMGLPTNIAQLEKLDPYTVRITLRQVDAAFIANMGLQFTSIHSAEYADLLLKSGKAAELNNKPIGTGPFVFRRYEKDAQVRFSAFDAYWGGKAGIDNLIFAITRDSAVRMQKLKANECQISAYPKPAEVTALKQAPGIKLMSQPGMNVGFLTLNVTRKPLDNADVRRAINLAIDRKALIEAVYQGAGELALNPLPPMILGYSKRIAAYPYDPAQARALLAKAGLAAGFDIKLWALPVQRPYNPNGQQAAELIQADLAKVGIRAQIVKYECAEYLKRAKAGESEIGMFGWTGDNGDPDNFLGTLFSCAAVGGSNYAQWCSKDYDAAVNQAKQTLDVGQRAALYEKALEIYHREAPGVPLAHSVVYQPMRSNVDGFKMSPFGTMQFYGVTLR